MFQEVLFGGYCQGKVSYDGVSIAACVVSEGENRRILPSFISTVTIALEVWLLPLAK